MASTFLPLVTNNVRFVTNHLGWSIIWFLSLIVFKPQIFKNKLLLFVFLYGILFLILLNTLWINVDEWNKGQITGECYKILLALSVLTYFRIEQDYFRFAKLVKWTMIFIFITAVLTIVTSLINPLYARQINSIDEVKLKSEVETILSYGKYGGGNYSFAIALLCLFPMLIYYFKNNFKSIINKQYTLIIVIVFFFALLRMQIFANILISLFAIAYSIMGGSNAKKILFISCLTIIVILFTPLQFYASILNNISTWFPDNSEIQLKLISMSKYLMFGESIHTEIGIRASRYPLLLPAFDANPLFGYFVTDHRSDISLGGHLHWMNKLAVYGLLGTIPFIYILYKFIKESIKYFDKEFTFYFLLSTFSVIVLGLMKALYGDEMWSVFFIIVPGLYYLPLLKKRNTSFHL